MKKIVILSVLVALSISEAVLAQSFRCQIFRDGSFAGGLGVSGQKVSGFIKDGKVQRTVSGTYKVDGMYGMVGLVPADILYNLPATCGGVGCYKPDVCYSQGPRSCSCTNKSYVAFADKAAQLIANLEVRCWEASAGKTEEHVTCSFPQKVSSTTVDGFLKGQVVSSSPSSPISGFICDAKAGCMVGSGSFSAGGVQLKDSSTGAQVSYEPTESSLTVSGKKTSFFKSVGPSVFPSALACISILETQPLPVCGLGCGGVKESCAPGM